MAMASASQSAVASRGCPRAPAARHARMNRRDWTRAERTSAACNTGRHRWKRSSRRRWSGDMRLSETNAASASTSIPFQDSRGMIEDVDGGEKTADNTIRLLLVYGRGREDENEFGDAATYDVVASHLCDKLQWSQDNVSCASIAFHALEDGGEASRYYDAVFLLGLDSGDLSRFADGTASEHVQKLVASFGGSPVVPFACAPSLDAIAEGGLRFGELSSGGGILGRINSMIQRLFGPYLKLKYLKYRVLTKKYCK